MGHHNETPLHRSGVAASVVLTAVGTPLRNMFLRALLVGCLAAGASATPAHAANGFERCLDGHMCIFDNREGTGTMAWFRTGSPDLAQHGMDNRASAFSNRTGREWITYDGKNYQDPLIYIGSGTGGSMIAELSDNRMSSLRVR